MGIAFEARQECRASFAPPILQPWLSEIIRGKGVRGIDVLMRQPRMIHQDRLGRHAGTEFAQNKLYRNTGTTNDWFAGHDIWVYFDAFVGHATGNPAFSP